MPPPFKKKESVWPCNMTLSRFPNKVLPATYRMRLSIVINQRERGPEMGTRMKQDEKHLEEGSGDDHPGWHSC